LGASHRKGKILKKEVNMIKVIPPQLAVAVAFDCEKEGEFLDKMIVQKWSGKTSSVFTLHHGSGGFELHFRKQEDCQKFLSYLKKYNIT